MFEQGGFFGYDVETYLKRMNLPHPPVTFVGVNGYDGYVYNFSIELEAVLDIDMVIAIDPQVKEVIAYEDGNDPFGVALIDALDQVAQDNKAQILSISYSIEESEEGTDQMNAENTALTQLASQGITVLASAGDDGAYGQTGTENYPATYNVSDPGSQPLITCVGGTSLATGRGQLCNRVSLESTVLGTARREVATAFIGQSHPASCLDGFDERRFFNLSQRTGCCCGRRSGYGSRSLFPAERRLVTDRRHQCIRSSLGWLSEHRKCRLRICR